MKRFRFRLEPLLRLRETERDRRRRELGEALALEAKLRGESASLDNRRGEQLDALREMTRQGLVDVDRILEARRYTSLLQAEIQVTQAQLEAVGQETERRRRALIEADRAVKILEKLRDRQSLRHRQAFRRKEAQINDEIAGRRGIRESSECELL